MDKKILNSLGLNAESTANDVLQSIKLLKTEVESKTLLSKQLSNKVSELENKVDDIRDSHSELAIDTIIGAAQASVGHFIPENTEDESVKNVISTIRQKARMALDADSQEEREAIESDIRTYCIAYGYNSKLENQLKKLNGEREIESATESERVHLKATKLAKESKMSYTEAVQQILGGNQ